MVEESKYCSDKEKKHFNKELVMTKKDGVEFETLLNVEYVIMLMLMMMLKQEIIVTSLENIEDLHTEIVISRLN